MFCEITSSNVHRFSSNLQNRHSFIQTNLMRGKKPYGQIKTKKTYHANYDYYTIPIGIAQLNTFSCAKNNDAIALHHNIQTIHFNSECLNIIRGATESNLVHSKLYRLTLNEWPEKIRTAPCIAHHFWGT